MRILLSILLFTIVLGGCTNYSKVIRLKPQKAIGWKLSNDLSVSECNNVEVLVRPVIISYEDWGWEFLFIPISKADKQLLNAANNKNPSVEITFRHWYRDKHIEACPLAAVRMENKNSLKQISPVSVQKLTTGEHVTKYSTVCTYFFDPQELSGDRFDLYINENAVGCKFEPIPGVYKKETLYTIYEWM